MILGLRTYRVQGATRKPLLDFMLDALRSSGCKILFTSPPDQAPFIVSFETGGGERIGIVAYAFTATRTPTKNRPPDERSFQIKYGSKEDNNLHELWQDPLGLFTTLLLGIDAEDGFFVGADPQMHNPTKFFIRLEFKDRHAEQIMKQGWFAWERQKFGQSDEPVEVLVGGTKDTFLRYVQFERDASGLDQGNRQLLAEKPSLFQIVSQEQSAARRLLNEFELTSEQVLNIIASAKRLKMAVRGWVAEDHLRKVLEGVPGVTECTAIEQDGRPDFEVRFEGGAPILVECKNVLRDRNKAGDPRLDFQRTRVSKGDPCSRYYAASEFQVVAACLHAVSEKWEFRYALTARLAPHNKCVGKLSNAVIVDATWSNDAAEAFKAVNVGSVT